MTETCDDCGKEFEEGDKFYLQENHRATIKDGWLHTGPNSLMQDKRYCKSCWRNR